MLQYNKRMNDLLSKVIYCIDHQNWEGMWLGMNKCIVSNFIFGMLTTCNNIHEMGKIIFISMEVNGNI